tara:strand:+ start:14981 stop:16162 length:1182 start_codon:yes stop_codon:yes gene_type:complete
MSKGTIIYIGGFELPDKNAAAHRVVNNGKALKTLGYDVVFVGIQKEDTSKIKKHSFFDFTVYSISYPNSKSSWFKYITEFNKYIDIVESHKNIHSLILYNLPAISIKRLLNYSRKKNIKIFSDCTEWYEAPKNGNLLMRLVKKFDVKYRMEKLHLQLDGIISISKFLHNYYSKHNTKSILLPPLVDTDDKKWKKKQVNYNKKVTDFVYAGSPFSIANKSAVKDKLDVIIDAFYKELKFNRNFHLHIIGVTLEDMLSFYPILQNKIEKLNNNVTFYGRREHVFVLDLLKKSDFSIFYRENTLTNTAGFPTKFVEAISASSAVITNSSSNIKDYLAEGKNSFLLPNDNSKSIEEVLHDVLNLSIEKKKEIKEYTNKNNLIFDYKNYLNQFKELLN